MPDEPACSIERSLQVLGDRWTLLIIREVYNGRHQFSEIRDSLGIASNLLSARLTRLVEGGVLRQRAYQSPGSRHRHSYHLTPAGEELRVILWAFQQWGDQHLPRPSGPSALRRERGTGRPVHVGFIGDDALEIASADVESVPNAAC